MATFTIVFTRPGSNPHNSVLPGWTTIEGCSHMDEALDRFDAMRAAGDIPANAEIDTIRQS